MATGNDNVDMTFLQANLLSVDGGTGFDRLDTTSTPATRTRSSLGWEVINGLPTTANLGGLINGTLTQV